MSPHSGPTRSWLSGQGAKQEPYVQFEVGGEAAVLCGFSQVRPWCARLPEPSEWGIQEGQGDDRGRTLWVAGN